jgi:glycosyltransferase involved in cell wall biosynthesis
VTPGVTGLLVAGRERADWTTSFGDAIGQLAARPDALRRMGEAAEREARARLSPRTMATATTALYREVVGA